MRNFRYLITLVAILLTASHAWALRGGPFDSSTDIGGLDPIRGTFQTVFRGENAIGYCFFSSASSLDAYGSTRGYVGESNVSGTVGAAVGDDEILVVFNFTGVNEFRRVEGVGYLDQKIESNFYPITANGKGEVSFRVTNITEQDVIIDDTGGAEKIEQVEVKDVGPVQTVEISGETRQLSATTSRLFVTITSGENSIGPIAIDPTDAEESINIFNQIRSGSN